MWKINRLAIYFHYKRRVGFSSQVYVHTIHNQIQRLPARIIHIAFRIAVQDHLKFFRVFAVQDEHCWTRTRESVTRVVKRVEVFSTSNKTTPRCWNDMDTKIIRGVDKKIKHYCRNNIYSNNAWEKGEVLLRDIVFEGITTQELRMKNERTKAWSRSAKRESDKSYEDMAKKNRGKKFRIQWNFSGVFSMLCCYWSRQGLRKTSR